MANIMESRAAIHELETRRNQLVEELLNIRSLVRGSLSEQFLKVPRKGTEEYVERGPYYVLSRSKEGKTDSERVKKKDVDRVKQDIANYRRFESVCEELAKLTEKLGELEREAAVEDAEVKKKPKSHSKRARKSSGS